MFPLHMLLSVLLVSYIVEYLYSNMGYFGVCLVDKEADTAMK